jgi:hypothetical protein
MEIKPIRTKTNYRAALKAVECLMTAKRIRLMEIAWTS